MISAANSSRSWRPRPARQPGEAGEVERDEAGQHRRPSGPNGSGTPSPKRTTAMVTTCPPTAIQRSWMSSSRFLRPAASSWPNRFASPSPAARGPTGERGVPSARAQASRPRRRRSSRTTQTTAPASIAGERVPGHGVDEVVVGEGDHGQPSDRIAARVGRGVRIDEIGRDRPETAGGGDRLDVARVPAIAGGIVAAEESALRLADAQQAGDAVSPATCPARDAVRGASARHEAAVDQHGEARVGAKRRHHPVARRRAPSPPAPGSRDR